MTLTEATQTKTPRPARTPFAPGLLALCVLALGACAKSKPDVTGSIASDYRDRHPIVLVTAQTGIDVYVGLNSGRLDPRQRDDVAAFAREFVQHGKGPMTALVPNSGGRPGINHRGLGAIRQAIAQGGMSSRQLVVSTYPAEGAPGEAPIRLSFARLKAQTATRCGQWPHDLADGSSFKGSLNQPYYNQGCAMQNMLAVQVDDPLDLVRARQETPIDSQRRIQVIDKMRGSEDPSTEWRAKSAINNNVGGAQ